MRQQNRQRGGESESPESIVNRGEMQFHQLLEKLPVGAYTCDADGQITYFNAGALELWGRAPKLNDPVDRFCGSFKLFSMNGAPLAHAECWMALALRDNKAYNGHEIQIERPNGQRVVALAHANPIHDETGKLIGAVNTLVDISDRKRVEDDLRRTKDERDAQLGDLNRLHEMSVRLSTTLELQPILEGILQTAAAIEGATMGLLSLCDDNELHLNVGASLGFDADILKLIERVPAGGGACGVCLQQRRRVIVEDVEHDPLFAKYLEVARRAGFRAVHSTPLITRMGQIIGVLSTHFHIPRRPSEREIYLLDLCARQAVDFIENARLYSELLENDRRKNEFLAMLAHELRNPLAPIQNAVQILRTADPDDSTRTWAQDVIDRQVRQMSRLVDDLLDLSRIKVGKLELRNARVELREILEAAIETSLPLFEARCQEFQVFMPSEPIYLEGDMTRLAQIVANLLNNSAKYTERGGRVVLCSERQGSDAVISVRDTGAGIPADMLPRIFEMFTQVNRSSDWSQGGLGVGLTLVKRLVEMHGGTVSARSDGPNKGSEFVVRLPVVLPPSSIDRGDREPAVSISAMRILVVDDNRDSAASLGMLLRIMGNEVRLAHDGQEAVNIAEEYRPDVVLLDIGLPRINGYEAARQIRQQPWGQRIVLIATTGWGQESDRRRSKDAGFDHHLVKPIHTASLGQLLASTQSALQGPRPGEVFTPTIG